MFIISYQGCILSSCPIPVDVDLDHLAEGVFVRSLQGNVTASNPMLSSLGGRRHGEHPPSNELGVMHPSLSYHFFLL